MHPPPFRRHQASRTGQTAASNCIVVADSRLSPACSSGTMAIERSPKCWPSCGAGSAGSPLPRSMCALDTASAPSALRRTGLSSWCRPFLIFRGSSEEDVKRLFHCEAENVAALFMQEFRVIPKGLLKNEAPLDD